MATTVSPEQIEQYRRDGFLVVDGVLTSEELDRYGAAVDAAVARRSDGDTRSLAEKTPYEQSFRQCMNLWEDCVDVRPLTFHPRIGEIAARLVGAPCLRLWHDQALYKEPGGRATDAHNDQPYWPMVETDTITAWIPFDGSTIAGGAMGYLPGSHRFEGVRRFANIFAGKGFDLGDPAVSRGVAPVFCEVPRGAVAFHHGLTIHLAGPNRTDRARRVHTMILFADGAHRSVPGHPHFAVDRAGIEPGEPIRSDVTPVMWPLPGGALPVPPPLPPSIHPSMPGWRPARAKGSEW
ncbi:MAG TPA: phytanoyl-CoA dioxygenase family protein [Myxococcota bacterium]|nr:phytanoyl-CoA dioxygenase family protein [Myxococcota bacterium]